MMYLLDTVALVRHFAGNKNIGHKAKEILNSIETTDNNFAISSISLMEILYLSEKNRIDIDFEETVSHITSNSSYQVVDLNTEILLTASMIKFYELHDRMILATAKWLDVPILSSDSKFGKVEGIQVIWD